jgi:Fe-S-cluster containining protein
MPVQKATAKTVERLSVMKEDENWAFRAFLKECDAGSEQIDAIVQGLFREESAAFDCTTCARCCKGISPMLDNDDVEKLAACLGMSPELVVSGYLVRDEEYDGLVFNKMPCPLLKENRCSCYDSRPRDCADYPHLHKDRFSGRLSNMVANCAVCPVVYNVFERMKEAMKPHGRGAGSRGRRRHRRP